MSRKRAFNKDCLNFTNVAESALENIVFGKSDQFKRSKDEDQDSENESGGNNWLSKRNKISFDISGSDSDSSSDEESIKRLEPDLKTVSQRSERKNEAWHDDDDDINIEEGFSNADKLPKQVRPDGKYRDFLTKKFSNNEVPSWASANKVSSESDSDSEDEVSRTAGNIVAHKDELNKGILDIKQVARLNREIQSKDIINSVVFHPTANVGLTSHAFNGIVHLFQVDGKINPRIQTIHFKQFRVSKAMFSTDGQQLIVGSNFDKGCFFYYDMICGKIVRIPFVVGKDRFMLNNFELSSDGKYIASVGENGTIHTLTAKTKEHIFDLKMNGEAKALTFTPDSTKLLCHGNEGRVYIWDLRKSNECVNRFQDEGCITGSSICISPNGRYCATGSDLGVCNIYDFSHVLIKSEPKPLRSILNLTTNVTKTLFNHSSELLIVASSYKENAVRCIHCPSLTVYSNFPELNRNYKRINDFDISINSGYLALSNNTGCAYLFRLRHFPQY